MNFWQALQKPIIGLSPMDGLTDYPFRSLVAKYSKPSVIFTEFVCVDQIKHAKSEIINEFLYDEKQRPIVAQIFGIDPELFYISAQIVCELGFDGIDINMGCPSKNVSQRGAGAGLIKNPKVAGEIIQATKKGINDWVEKGLDSKIDGRVLAKTLATKNALINLGVIFKIKRDSIPISVKTRIGYVENEIDSWISYLISQDLACISLHGRTYKQMYKGLADWEAISHAAKLIKESSKKDKTIILGNGDISSLEMAKEYSEKFGVDGSLIGRGFLGKPWLLDPESFSFSPKERIVNTNGGIQVKNQINDIDIERNVDTSKIFAIIREHSALQQQFQAEKFFNIRKHLAWYCRGFKGASNLRQQLVLTKNLSDVEEILKSFNENK